MNCTIWHIRWVGGSACRVLLWPFWSRATLRATLKSCDRDAIACKVSCSCQACDAGLESQNGGQWVAKKLVVGGEVDMDPVHFRAVGVRVRAALGAKTIMFVAAWSRVLTFWQLVALLSSQTVELL